MYYRNADFSDHELLTSRLDAKAGLSAFIAVHNSRLGPAIGGCRMMAYSSVDDAVTDVLRLSRGMTYKSAIARIPYGGGKAVIIADPRTQKTPSLFHAMGDFVDSLGGRYITSFDSGTTLDDVQSIAERTRYTAGTTPDAGNASSSTAFGVFHCLKAGVAMRFGGSDLSGVRVAIQGLGNVGRRLAKLLAEAGAVLTVADIDPQVATAVAADTGAAIAPPNEIHRIRADVFAPCALGAVLSAQTIGEIQARVVVGGANNQLAEREDDARLAAAGILYCPDFLANAGGIIDLHYQQTGWSKLAVDHHVAGLAETFQEVVAQSRKTGLGPSEVALEVVEDRLLRADLT